MEQLLKRLIFSLFPELKNGYHKPQLGRVVSIPDNADGVSTQAEPIHCINLQPLDEHLKDRGPVLRDVAVSLPFVGDDRGFFALPEADSIVEFTFSYFMPNLIHVRGVLPWGKKIPAVDAGVMIKESEECYMEYNNGQVLQVQKLLESTSSVKQLLKSPKTWIGSDSDNVLKILSDFMQSTADALTTLASHTHPNVGPNAQGADATAKAAEITQAKTKLDGISE